MKVRYYDPNKMSVLKGL